MHLGAAAWQGMPHLWLLCCAACLKALTLLSAVLHSCQDIEARLKQKIQAVNEDMSLPKDIAARVGGQPGSGQAYGEHREGGTSKVGLPRALFAASAPLWVRSLTDSTHAACATSNIQDPCSMKMGQLWHTGSFGASGALEACNGEAGPSGEPSSGLLLQTAAAVLVAAAAACMHAAPRLH